MEVSPMMRTRSVNTPPLGTSPVVPLLLFSLVPAIRNLRPGLRQVAVEHPRKSCCQAELIRAEPYRTHVDMSSAVQNSLNGLIDRCILSDVQIQHSLLPDYRPIVYQLQHGVPAKVGYHHLTC